VNQSVFHPPCVSTRILPERRREIGITNFRASRHRRQVGKASDHTCHEWTQRKSSGMYSARVPAAKYSPLPPSFLKSKIMLHPMTEKSSQKTCNLLKYKRLRHFFLRNKAQALYCFRVIAAMWIFRDFEPVFVVMRFGRAFPIRENRRAGKENTTRAGGFSLYLLNNLYI